MAEKKVRIERMSYGGAGFGRVEGQACFVPLTAPDEEVRFRVTKEKRSYLEGEVVEILSPSPLRCAPSCPVFGSCGGCNWQHLPYEVQLAQKGEIFADTLGRMGQVERGVIRPVLPSPTPFDYRSRVQLKVSCRDGAVRIGFFKGLTHEVVDAAACGIAHPQLNAVLAELRRAIRSFPSYRSVVQLDLAMGDDLETIVIVHYHCPPAQLAKGLLALRESLPSVQGLFLRCGTGRPEKVYGIEKLCYRVPAHWLPDSPQLALCFAGGNFSQVNYPQNLQLIRLVWELGRFTGQERVLDLYCGNGNFSLPLARYVSEVVGVEGNRAAVADAKGNAAANGIENARFRACDAAQAVGELVAAGERFDTVILDPPRSGAVAVAEIAALEPASIVYVSCDPPTLARDLRLLQERGYRTVESAPVDMFPQTYHLESVTLLQRNH